MLPNSKTIHTKFLVDESVTLQDRISVPTKRTLTDSGQMHVPCTFARTGMQLYTAKQLGLTDREPNEVIQVFRDEASVFAEDSMATFKSAPLTLGHPKDDQGKAIAVTSENAKDLQVGMLEGLPTRDEDTLTGTLIITNQEAIDALESGEQELSAGYLCDIEEIDGKFYQRNIRANHIAIVAKGRAGSSCRISDEADLYLGDVLLSTQESLQDAILAKATIADELEVQKQLVIDFKASAEEADIRCEKLKVELADAKVAAEEGVVERCAAIENARLVADMRDLGSKSVNEIYRMVVEDQMPEKDLSGKGDAFIAAMFEILVDAAKGETPMGKLLSKQDFTTDEKVIAPKSKVVEARNKMIARQTK